MRKIVNIIKNEAYLAFNNKMIFLCFIFSILAVPIMKMFKFFSVAEQMKMIKDFSFSIVTLMGIVLSIFYPGYSLKEDFERKYIFNMFSKPISRAAYFAGKLLAFCFVITVITLANFLVLYIMMALKGYSFSIYYIEAGILLLLKFYIIISLSMLFSLLPVSYHVSSILTLFIFILGTLKMYVLTIVKYSKLSTFSKISMPFLKIAPNFQMFDVYESIIGGDILFFKDFIKIAIYGIVYILIFYIISFFIINRKEL